MTAIVGAQGPVAAPSSNHRAGTSLGKPAIRLDSVVRDFAAQNRGGSGTRALDGIHLEVPTGGFVALVGASGCGKTTLLNLVAGLDHPSSGTVEVTGKPTLMFQEAALFPWLTVTRNVELPMRFGGVPKAERAERAAELIDKVGLSSFAKHRPHQLSGGMRQRVALARALAQDTDIILMDEPFGALDAITRDNLHDELERLWLERRFTVVFVTHNVREAVRLAEKVVLLKPRPGRIAATFDLDLERPRHIEDPHVAARAKEITDRLRTEAAS